MLLMTCEVRREFLLTTVEYRQLLKIIIPLRSLSHLSCSFPKAWTLKGMKLRHASSHNEEKDFCVQYFRHSFHPVAYSGFFRGGGGVSTNSVEDRGQRERGSGDGNPLVRGSGGSCNLGQEISFHKVNVS
jgi:hypothetical protein